MEKITVKNCTEIVNELRNKQDNGDVYSKGAAWDVVFFFCKQNGMRETDKTGIEQVISFIGRKLKIPA